MVGYVIHYKKNNNNNNINNNSNNSSSSNNNNNNSNEDDDDDGGGDVMVKTKKKGGDDGEGEEEEEERRRRLQARGRGRGRGRKSRPEWAERLLRGRFFGACAAHAGMRKGEENFFCVDCGCRMCFHCLAAAAAAAARQGQGHQGHAGHTLLQIRKYVYRDVVRVVDLQKLLDLSRIQPYTVNGAKVVHLNPRDKSTPSKPNSGGPACRICRQSVCGDSNSYCSVACKLSDKERDEEEPEPSDDNAAERSEPSIHDPTSDIDDNGTTDKEVDSYLVSSQKQQQQRQRQQQQQQPYDSGEENQGSRKQRRKGVPRRAPEF